MYVCMHVCNKTDDDLVYLNFLRQRFTAVFDWIHHLTIENCTYIDMRSNRINIGI